MLYPGLSRLEAVLRAGEAYRRSTCTGGTLSDDIRWWLENDFYDEREQEALAMKLNKVGRARLSKEVRQKPALIALVDKNRPDYAQLARMVVKQNPEDLGYVNIKHAVYGELAPMVVQSYPRILRFVDKDYADYGAIAKIAVQKNGLVLQYVGRHHDTEFDGRLGPEGEDEEWWRETKGWRPDFDYDEIAKLAVEEDADALEHVFARKVANYYEIAKIAVEEDGQTLSFAWRYRRYPDVMSDAQFKALVLAAVRQNPGEMCEYLQHVPQDPDVLAMIAQCQAMVVRLPAVPF